jgi:RNA polymerase sigma-70 factor (ECF subfamily)
VLAAHVPVLLRVARGLCRDPAQADDLVQDTLERALRSIDTLDLEHNPRSWLVAILYNLHIDRCRQKARAQPHVPCDDLPLVAPEHHVPRWSMLTADDVQRAAERLPDELRAVYLLFAFERRSYIEIAEALQIPKSTVGTRVLRARAHLKKLLFADLGEEES